MKQVIRFITAIAIIICLIVIGCEDNSVIGPETIEYGVNILSPKDNSVYTKLEMITFEAALSDSNNSQDLDSIKWVSNISGVILKYNGWGKRLVAGTHLITCKMFRDDVIYVSKAIRIIVEEQVRIDTLLISDDLELFQLIGVNNTTISIDKNDNVLLGTTQGMLQKSSTNWNHYLDELMAHEIQTIAVDMNNVIHIGYMTRDGISRQTNDGWETIEMDNSLGGDVHRIEFDASNNLWAATHYGGIVQYLNNNWLAFEDQPMLFHHPNSLFFDENSILWGSCEYGCFKFDGQNWELIKFNQELLKAFAFTVDNDGTIWSLYQAKLFKISDAESKIYTYKDYEYLSFNPYSMAVDLNNNLLLGSRNGIIKYDGTNWELLSLPADDKVIYDIKVDSKNRIWFFTENYFGVYKNH